MLKAACEATTYAGIGFGTLIGSVLLALILVGELRARRHRRVMERERREWCAQNGFTIDDDVVGDGAWPKVRP